MSDTRVNNYVLGAGRLFFAPVAEDGSVRAERYIGNTPGFEISVESTRINLYDSDGPTAEKVEDVGTHVVRSSVILCNNISDENHARCVIGELSSITSTSGPAIGEDIGVVEADPSYQLGVSDATPAGKRALSNVELYDENGAFEEGVDYILEADLGRFYVRPEGSMAGKSIEADYETTDGSISRIVTS